MSRAANGAFLGIMLWVIAIFAITYQPLTRQVARVIDRAYGTGNVRMANN